MSRRTPGPWYADSGDHGLIMASGPIAQVFGDDELDGWRESGALDLSDEEWGALKDSAEANARLIAHAPDLLEMLEEAVHFISDDLCGHAPIVKQRALKLIHEAGGSTAGNLLAWNKEVETPEEVKQALTAATEAFGPVDEADEIVSQAQAILRTYSSPPTSGNYGIDSAAEDVLERLLEIAKSLNPKAHNLHHLSVFCEGCIEKIFKAYKDGGGELEWGELICEDSDWESWCFCDVCGTELVTHPATPCFFEYELGDREIEPASWTPTLEAHIFDVMFEHIGVAYDSEKTRLEEFAKAIVAWSQSEEGKRFLAENRRIEPNTNCLEGVECPVCGNRERVYISAVVECEVTDEGVEDTGSAEWDDGSKCRCAECKHDGTVGEFKGK